MLYIREESAPTSATCSCCGSSAGRSSPPERNPREKASKSLEITRKPAFLGRFQGPRPSKCHVRALSTRWKPPRAPERQCRRSPIARLGRAPGSRDGSRPRLYLDRFLLKLGLQTPCELFGRRFQALITFPQGDRSPRHSQRSAPSTRSSS